VSRSTIAVGYLLTTPSISIHSSYVPVICSGLTSDDLTTQVVDPVSLSTKVVVSFTQPSQHGVIGDRHSFNLTCPSGLRAPATTSIIQPQASFISPSPRESSHWCGLIFCLMAHMSFAAFQQSCKVRLFLTSDTGFVCVPHDYIGNIPCCWYSFGHLSASDTHWCSDFSNCSSRNKVEHLMGHAADHHLV